MDDTGLNYKRLHERMIIGQGEQSAPEFNANKE